MNQETHEHALATLPSPLEMVMNPASIDHMLRIAELMASGRSTIPAHLRGNVGDCFAIVMQAMRWNMDPFAVAQKTHITQGGALGYEAQLISAVITSLAPITRRPDYVYLGDWNNVLGKVEERQGKAKADGKEGGKYYAATYTKKDEEGLGVSVSATFIGESKPREVTVMMSQAWPRFSTQWATDPKQQIGYLAIRKWGRRYTPDVLLGVYTPEELELRGERDMGRADEVPQRDKPGASSRTESVRGKLATRSRTALAPPGVDEILGNIAAATTQQELAHAIEPVIRIASEPDKERIRDAYAAKVRSEKERLHRESQTDSPSPATYDGIADRMKKATTINDLDDAVDLARGLDDPQQREALSEMYTERRALMEE